MRAFLSTRHEDKLLIPLFALAAPKGNHQSLIIILQQHASVCGERKAGGRHCKFPGQSAQHSGGRPAGGQSVGVEEVHLSAHSASLKERRQGQTMCHFSVRWDTSCPRWTILSKACPRLVFWWKLMSKVPQCWSVTCTFGEQLFYFN